MKRKTMNLTQRLVFSKKTIAALNEAQQGNVIGGEPTDLGFQTGVVTEKCPTMGLGKELSRCCPVYVPSVNVACIS